MLANKWQYLKSLPLYDNHETYWFTKLLLFTQLFESLLWDIEKTIEHELYIPV